MKFLLIALIRVYQFTLSPLLGSCCRFTPSCSSYGIEAIRQHGWLRGSVLCVSRVFRCHPFGPGGFDPVPAGKSHTRPDTAEALR